MKFATFHIPGTIIDLGEVSLLRHSRQPHVPARDTLRPGYIREQRNQRSDTEQLLPLVLHTGYVSLDVRRGRFLLVAVCRHVVRVVAPRH